MTVNHVTFSTDASYKIVSGRYIIEDFCITKGQNSNNDIHKGLIVTCDRSGKFSFPVGRKSSDEVAEWFNQHIKPWQNTFNHPAGRLNFAFIGTLELTLIGGRVGELGRVYRFKGIVLAQGHSGTTNNWWFGGNNCTNQMNDNNVTVTGYEVDNPHSAITVQFWRGQNGVSQVDLSIGSFLDTANWLSLLTDSTRLNQIIMPGSHDAGMSVLEHCAPPIFSKPYTKTQAVSVGYQLLRGARYFDIRVDYDYGNLVTYHRSGQWGCNGESLSSVLQDTINFLESCPSEFAIFKFSHIRRDKGHDSADIKKRIEEILNDYSDYIYTNIDNQINLALLPLGDVRGKVILVFDYDNYFNPSLGRFRFFEASVAYDNINFTLAGKYSNTSDYNIMAEDQLKKWEQYAGLGQEYFFLLSWTLTARGGATIEELAAIANSNLSSVLSNKIIDIQSTKPNIIYLDFIDYPVTEAVIRYNFLAEKSAS